MVLEIPKPLRKAFGGKARLKRTLKTDSLRVANDRKHAWVAEFKRQITVTSTQTTETALAPDMLKEALAVRAQYDSSKRSSVGVEGGEGWLLADHDFSDIVDRAQEIERDEGAKAARAFFNAATGRFTSLRELSTEWISMRRGTVRASVSDQQRAVLNRFLKWAGEDTAVEHVDRRMAGDYRTFLFSPASEIMPGTAIRHIAALKVFWVWLIDRGIVESSPWHTRSKALKVPSDRAQLSEEALSALLGGTPHHRSSYGVIMHDLVRLGLVTGARLNELCGLRSQDLEQRGDGWWLLIREYEGHELKNENSVRDIPLHETVAHVARRRKQTPGGFIFPDLTSGGPDHRRSWNVSRAFSAYRKHVGVKGRGEVFHSLRNTFAEYMEGCGVPMPTIKLLLGHNRMSLLGATATYSKGERVDLRGAIGQLSFSPAVTRLLSEEE